MPRIIKKAASEYVNKCKTRINVLDIPESK